MQLTVVRLLVTWLMAPTLLFSHLASIPINRFTFFQRIFVGIVFNYILKIHKTKRSQCTQLICTRSVKIDFKGKVEYAGIPAYHFETTDDFLRNIGPEFGNECFCVDRIPSVPNRPNGCLHRGAVDLSNCQGKCNVHLLCIFLLGRPLEKIHLF